MKLKFEFKITIAYLIIGSSWILFSDKAVHLISHDIDVLTELQTYKGWFYVFATAFLLFLFLKKHLKKLRNTEEELEKHKNSLQDLVSVRTEELYAAIKQLKTKNEELFDKNDIINKQNKELKEALQQLKHTQSQLVQTEKMASLGVLTAGVAHEINNPLNYIQTSLFAIEENLKHEKDPENLNKNLHTLLSAMKTGVKKTTGIVKALNTFSRKGSQVKNPCNIRNIIDNCLLLLNHEIKNKCLVIKDFTNTPFVLEASEDSLHQVFTNLIMNSLQSIQSKGEITISTNIDKEKEQLIVEILDNGEGISKENLPKIFDPFFTTKAPGKGVGIGLSIVYNIIKEHHGTINYQSDQKKGTRVTILLPVKI